MALAAGDVNTLFNEVGKALNAGNVNIDANKTTGTVPLTIQPFLANVGNTGTNHTTEILDSVAGAAKAVSPLLAAGQSFNSTVVQTPIQNLVVQTIKADSQQPNDGALTAVRELIRQMKVVPTPQTLDSSAPTVSTIVYGDSFTGTHTAGNNEATRMTDSTAAFVVDALIGRTIRNVTDGSSGVITDNAATTIDVAALTGGTDDDWDTNDVYVVDGTTTASSNNGDGSLKADTKRGDGLVNEHIIPEDIEGNVTSISANGQASFQLRGEALVGKMSPDWPGGSGITTTLTSFVGASAANLVNGTFEVGDTNEADLPNGWISAVGLTNLGTTFNLTPVEVQTITVTNTPTTGYYVITHVDKDANEQDTVPLVYNAAASAVQSALRNLNGLGEVTVSSGATTSPNFTHTITMTGVTNPGQFTVAEETDVGTYTPATTTPASANVMRGARAIQFTGDAAPELTSIMHPVTLQPATVYACSIWGMTDDADSGGVMAMDLVDSVGSPAVINDDQGTANTIALDPTALTATYVQTSGFFRTPTIMPNSVYLRLHASTAIDNTKDAFFDELCLVPASELYPGGPFAAMFTGPTDWVDTDTLKFSPANAQAGAIHTWMDRIFDLAGNRELFLTNTVGVIGDAKIS